MENDRKNFLFQINDNSESNGELEEIKIINKPEKSNEQKPFECPLIRKWKAYKKYPRLYAILVML